MKKKTLALLLALCMMFSLLPFGAAAAGFQDVKPGAYYYDPVDWAVNHDPQITKGTSSTTFSPDNTCKRCEVVTFLWRAFGAEKMTGENPFVDVQTNDYFYDAVLWAVEKGVTNGTDDTHFSPNNSCTREQVATFLHRASGKPDTKLLVSPFADVLDKEWYSFTPILWAYENGITNGVRVNAFGPASPCTRGQIVTFLYRALAKPLAPVETDGKFHFQPKVASKYFTEIFGETMVEAWFNLVDAIMAGKTEFACPDDQTFDWVTGQFPDKCLPLLHGHIWAVDPDDPVKNGVGRFMYDIPYAEVQSLIADFSKLVEDILNETMKPENSDFEKALLLYNYFDSHYNYDWDTYDDNYHGKAYYLSSYRMLTEKKGICQELSVAYSYLLMQAGVETGTVAGVGENQEGHQWSYIRLGGHDYHIDPTWVLEKDGKLAYFLMTDAERSSQGGFPIDGFWYLSNYSQDHPHPAYAANDETFAELWDCYFDSLDYENQILNYIYYGEFAQTEVRQFNYKGF
ncbi:MAG: S-layer homology domain-containing protein [Oscillospiraceae bacterium]|nr:S-layer homology domain-containing protein [Oscillospiraceae bacterium]